MLLPARETPAPVLLDQTGSSRQLTLLHVMPAAPINADEWTETGQFARQAGPASRARTCDWDHQMPRAVQVSNPVVILAAFEALPATITVDDRNFT